MMFCVQQRIFIYDTFVKRSSWKKCRIKYPNTAVPSKSMICKLVATFRATGSVLDKKKNKKKRAYSDRRKIGRDRCSFRSQSEKVTAPISSSMRGVKIGCARSNKIA
jgi:formylmethanofuran dehydrogenase subunit E